MHGYDNVTDRTGLSTEVCADGNIIDLNEHNLKDTVNGHIAIQQIKSSDENKYTKRTKQYKQQVAKTGTTNNFDYSLLDNLEIY